MNLKDYKKFKKNFQKIIDSRNFEELADFAWRLLTLFSYEERDIEAEEKGWVKSANSTTYTGPAEDQLEGFIIKELNSPEIKTFFAKVHPVSVNRLAQIGVNKKTGKRYVIKSKEYKQFQELLGYQIPYQEKGFFKVKVGVQITYGLKYPLKADLDNLNKAVLDVLQAKNYFNDDRYVFWLGVSKEQSDEEFIKGSVFKL